MLRIVSESVMRCGILEHNQPTGKRIPEPFPMNERSTGDEHID